MNNIISTLNILKKFFIIIFKILIFNLFQYYSIVQKSFTFKYNIYLI